MRGKCKLRALNAGGLYAPAAMLIANLSVSLHGSIAISRFPIQLFYFAVDAQSTKPKINLTKHGNVGISNSSKAVPPLRVGPKNALNRAILSGMIWIAQSFTI